MKKTLFTLAPFALLGISNTVAQQASTAYIQAVKVYQQHLNDTFANPEESPLTQEALKKFKGLDFFPISEKYRLKAKFIRTPHEPPFRMITTTDRRPVYEKYGEVHFMLDEKAITLNVYQSHSLRETAEYRNYLFLPFTDLTNGQETYEGGRFIDLAIPEGHEITIDFNKAYNPYCAYNGKYSCPIPPKENHIALSIRAGVKKFRAK